MKTQNDRLPENWRKLSLENFYYYKDTLVRRIDRENGEIKLVAQDFTNKRCSIFAQDIYEAMKKMEERLNFSKYN